MFTNINELAFIISESCNLKCSYCHFVKKVTNDHFEENKKIAQSFRSGEYLQLYKNFVNEYNIDINKITRASLWGQEPTLNLDSFNTQIPNLLDWLFNLHFFFFSTNGVAYIDRIIECVDIFNQYFLAHNRPPFILLIQFSFDGITYIEEQRGIKPEIIIGNIEKLINYLNNIQLSNNLTIKLCLHGVVDINHVKEELYLNNNYWFNTEILINKLKSSIKNKQVILDRYSVFFTYPYNATVEDGKILLEYAKYCFKSINDKYYPLLIDYMSPFYLMKDTIKFIQCNTKLLNNKIINNFNFIPDDIIIKFSSCDPYERRITLRYDGTLLYCQNTIFDLKNIKTNREKIDYDLSQYLQLHPRFQPNILSSSKEDIYSYFNCFKNEDKYIYGFLHSNIINLMYLLLQNHQIDESYNNKEKLLRHALYIAKAGQCYHGRKIETGSIYCNTIGFIRMYCNGLLDYLENLIINEQIENWQEDKYLL